MEMIAYVNRPGEVLTYSREGLMHRWFLYWICRNPYIPFQMFEARHAEISNEELMQTLHKIDGRVYACSDS